MTSDRTPDLSTAVVDIDGTLLDSNYQLSVAWARAFAHLGHDVPLWRIHRHMGMGGDRLVAAVAGQEAEDRDGDAVRERWEKEYDDLLGETRLFEGACDLLEGLRRAGLTVVLASSSIPRHAEHALRLLDAEHRVDAWTTSEDAEESKPDPDLVQQALAKVGAEASGAVMLGDAVWDVEAAARSRIPTVTLLCGGFGRDELLDAGAVGVYDDPRDLLDRLDEALARARS
jgi:HAD superfamily hydrolase (TIGR01509 family)